MPGIQKTSFCPQGIHNQFLYLPAGLSHCKTARRARGKTHGFAIVFLDSGSEIFPAISDFPKDLAPELRSPLCPDPKEYSELFREAHLSAKAGKSPGYEAASGRKPTGGPASCSPLGGWGWEDLPLS